MTTWMLYALLIGGLAAAAGVLLERAARLLRAPARFAWMVALAVAIIGPIAIPAIPLPVPESRFDEGPNASIGLGVIRPIPVSPGIEQRIGSMTRSLDRPLFILWTLLTGLCAWRLAGGFLAMRRRRSEWSLREIEGTTVFITPDLGPAVVPMPEARIILPTWALALDRAALATVVRHEEQHRRAGDVWLIVAGSVAAAIMPWNPGVWFVRRRLRLALEMDCDARVLSESPGIARYGSLLLAISQHPRLVPRLAATLTESTSDLERRIEAMTDSTPSAPRLRALAFTGAALAILGASCSVPTPDAVGAPEASDASSAYYDFQVTRPASAVASNTPPRYPAQLRAANIEGQVIAKFVIDTTGRVEMRTFEIIRSDHTLFSEAVHEGLPAMRFHPAQVGSHKVKQLVQMPFSFSLVR